MELCKENLKETLKYIPRFLNGIEFENIECLDYFIRSEIFKDILKCVNHLHQLNPPIIHRDLKPPNILVSFDGKIKLGDFGEAVLHFTESMSHTVRRGTTAYMAPEVCNAYTKTYKYSTQADIYSLGVILQEMFEIDIN